MFSPQSQHTLQVVRQYPESLEPGPLIHLPSP